MWFRRQKSSGTGRSVPDAPDAPDAPSRTPPGRPCGALGGNWCQQYGHDRYGNRWIGSWSGIAPQTNTPQSSSEFDSSNHLTKNGAEMDWSGNLLQIGSQQFTYDAENRLVTAGSVSYVYDGEGRRVQKTGLNPTTQSVVTTNYVYDASGGLMAEYTVGGTAPAAPCGTCYVMTDHLGSTRMMTNESGGMVAYHDYQPFGEEIAGNIGARTTLWGKIDNPAQKFTGKEHNIWREKITGGSTIFQVSVR